MTADWTLEDIEDYQRTIWNQAVQAAIERVVSKCYFIWSTEEVLNVLKELKQDE